MSKTLIIAPNWIGDAVMTEPLLRGLQQHNAELTVLATPWVAPVYRVMPGIQEIITMDFSHGQLEWSKRRAMAKLCKQKKFAQAFVLPNSAKSILIPVLARIPLILGYQGEFRSAFLSQQLPNPPKKNRPPMVDHYLNLLQLIEPKSTPRDRSDTPTLQISPEAQAAALQLLNLQDQPKPFYIFAPGAEFGPAKQWPSSHFAQLAEKILAQSAHACVVLVGSVKDIAISADILQNVPLSLHARIINLCGLASLDQCIALIPGAQGLASNDSGLMHVAAAFKIPQIAFYGSSDPKHTPPLSPFAGILFQGLDCSPCHQRQCPLEHLNCLRQITPTAALHELDRCITLRNTL